jgi:hypothetical protein
MIFNEQSKDLLTIEPLLLVKPLLKWKLRVIHGLLVPDSISLAEDGLSDGSIEVNHLIVDEGWKFGLWQLRLSEEILLEWRIPR